MGGAEKIILQLAEYFSSQYRVYILSDDNRHDWKKLNTYASIRHLYVPYGTKNILKVVLSLLFLAFYLIIYKPSLVHCHHRRITLIFSVYKSLPVFPFRLLHTSHNVFEYGRFFRQAKADLYTGVSRSVINNLSEFFRFDQNKIQLIYNGIAEYNGKEFPVKAKSAVTVARLTEQKGHIYLIRAWVDVVAHIPEAALYIVGDGELREKLERDVADLNLSKNVFFEGFQSNPMEWILQAEFCILPSLWEGLPLFPLEAFSVKRTITATAVDGTSEVVVDKKTGLLVPPQDVDRLAEAIIFLFEDREARERLAGDGYKTFAANFTLDKMLNAYKNIYQQFIV